MAHGTGGRWDDVLALVPGDHVHLDELVDRPPPPSSPDWLPIVDEVTRVLADSDGHWMVSLLLGECDELPTDNPTVSEARSLATRVNDIHPPAVYRWPDASTADTWQGERRSWKRRTGDQVTEIVTLSRSAIEAAAGEGYSVWISYEVGDSHR